MPKRKTQAEFLKEVEEIFGDEYIVLGEYINNKTPIKIKHTKCNNEFDKIPKDMIGKHSGCPYCNGNKNKLYNEKWVKNNTNYPYEYISGYTKMSEKCKFYCHNCGEYFFQSPKRLLIQKIYGCGCCPTKRKTHESFLKELGEDFLERYSVNEKYINADTKISFTHLECGTEFKIEPEKLLHRYHKEYCPICYYKKSKGEVIINAYLVKNKIKYIKEYSFKELPNRRFDFYLPEYNVCIEYDGKQHFEKNSFFKDENLQDRDNEKNAFCIKNNITLFRIPYSEINNINFILDKIFEEECSETIEKYKIY